jgi:antibiotic biosynthesis monooxygenase (ABM) superfamily enzyme
MMNLSFAVFQIMKPEEKRPMGIEVHVQGRVESGHLADFYEAVKKYQEYAKSHGYTVAKVLFGLSGQMNTVRLVYQYDDLNGYESHEVRTLTDRDYAEIAQQMRFVDGSSRYEIYRVL